MEDAWEKCRAIREENLRRQREEAMCLAPAVPSAIDVKVVYRSSARPRTARLAAVASTARTVFVACLLAVMMIWPSRRI